MQGWTAGATWGLGTGLVNVIPTAKHNNFIKPLALTQTFGLFRSRRWRIKNGEDYLPIPTARTR